MAKNFVQEGKTLNYTAGADTPATNISSSLVCL